MCVVLNLQLYSGSDSPKDFLKPNWRMPCQIKWLCHGVFRFDFSNAYPRMSHEPLIWGWVRRQYDKESMHFFFVVLSLDPALHTATNTFKCSGDGFWELVTVSTGWRQAIFTGCYRIPGFHSKESITIGVGTF